MARHDIAPIGLSQLVAALSGVVGVEGSESVVVTGVTSDSRDVRPGDLFCCIRGATADGHVHASDAVGAGAVALLVDTPNAVSVPDGTAVVVVPSVREALGSLAARAFGNPASEMRMVGVTGTNGKTSTVAILSAILDEAGERVTTIGTLNGARTTPEALDLHAALREAVDGGTTCVVMEVSSHALAMHRVDAVSFEVGVFTNLGRDHLDFHGTMEMYAAAKARLFDAHRCRVAVVNRDDPYSDTMLAGAAEYTTFGLEDATHVEVGVSRVAFDWRDRRIVVPIGGAFTVLNALAAVTAASSMGVALDDIVAGCAKVPPVRGRFESVPNDSGISVVVDYAHTTEAMERLLSTARDTGPGRLIVVFGCGGDRDAGKRRPMGSVASRVADVVFVTSDNPRSESPSAIISEILAGTRDGRAEVRTVEDRAAAIESAILGARRGDMVVIAGKGHETWQEIDGRRIPFDDAEVARRAIAARATDDMRTNQETTEVDGE